MNSSHGDLFIVCYRMMAFSDRDLKGYFPKHGYSFSTKGLYLFLRMVLLLLSTGVVGRINSNGKRKTDIGIWEKMSVLYINREVYLG